MAEYEPLELTDLCNISAEVLGEDTLARLGAQTYRGLPFTIGNASTGQVAMLGDGGHTEPVRRAVGRPARTVVFAHILLDPLLHQGGVPSDVE